MNSQTTVIVAISCAIACLTIACVTALCILRPGDNTGLITMIIGFASVMVTSLTTLIKLSGVETKTNGKMEQLLQLTAANATMAEATKHPPGVPGVTTTTAVTTFEPHTEPPKP
jgi:hypothetical protein